MECRDVETKIQIYPCKHLPPFLAVFFCAGYRGGFMASADSGEGALVVSVYHVPEQVFTMSPDRTPSRERGSSVQALFSGEPSTISGPHQDVKIVCDTGPGKARTAGENDGAVSTPDQTRSVQQCCRYLTGCFPDNLLLSAGVH